MEDTDNNNGICHNIGHKREGAKLEIDDSNPYAEFCPMEICPRKKMKQMPTSQIAESFDSGVEVNMESSVVAAVETMEDAPLPEIEDVLRPQMEITTTDENKVGHVKEPLSSPGGIDEISTRITYACQGPGCQEEFTSLTEHDMHYQSRHRNICTECKRSLKSQHLLDLHLMEKHDSYFAAISLKKPSYLCLIETCKQRFMNPEERKVHCLSEHPFLKNFLQNASDSKIIAVEPFVRETYSAPSRKPKVVKVESRVKEELKKSLPEATQKTHEAKSVVNEKKKALHISFGHHGERFIPRQVFAMQKKKNHDITSKMDTVDFSELQKSLLL